MDLRDNYKTLGNSFNQQVKEFKCASCSSNLEKDDAFCPECGTKVVQEITICRVCSTENNSQDFCSDCGANLKPHICTSCNTESFEDFCESCGTAISELGQSFVQNTKTLIQPQVMSSEEADIILKSLQAQLTPETKKMQEKMRQRIILQREREFSQEREERIQNYKTSGLKKVQTIQTEELKKIQSQMKTFSGYIKRKVEEKEAEERRIEEAQKAEEARIRMLNRVNGLWVSTVARTSITLDLIEVSNSNVGKMYLVSSVHETIDILKVNWNGNNIEFYTTKTFIKWISPEAYRVNAHFSGRVSEDGEMMTGYMSSAENWQEVFIKN